MTDHVVKLPRGVRILENGRAIKRLEIDLPPGFAANETATSAPTAAPSVQEGGGMPQEQPKQDAYVRIGLEFLKSGIHLDIFDGLIRELGLEELDRQVRAVGVERVAAGAEMSRFARDFWDKAKKTGEVIRYGHRGAKKDDDS